MKTIILTQGKVALVDDADYAWLNQWKWTASRNSKKTNTWYAMRRGPRPRREHFLMHREIAARAGFPEVDHRDLDGLNNQRHNLRPCTKVQQSANRAKMLGHTSQFKGVHWNNERSKWRAFICINGKTVHLGRYTEETDAARAYENAAKEAFGEFARA